MTKRIVALRNRARETVAEVMPSSGSTETISILDEARKLANNFAEQHIDIAPYELLVGGARRVAAPPEVYPKIFDRHSWSCGGFTGMPHDVEVSFTDGLLAWAGNHQTLDFDTVFELGIEGIQKRITTEICQQTGDAREFLQAMDIVASGYLGLCRRYAALAQEQAAITPHPKRKAELLTIAASCVRTPALPPRTFWEACQCAWSAFLLVPDAPGRLDQYLYPFYIRDISEQRITREDAKELLSALWIKYFEHVGVQSGVSAHNHMTLGGVTPNGENAANELTMLCLEVAEEIGLHRPQVGLRVSPSTPEEVLRRGVRVLRSRTGNPDFCNDEYIVPALVDVGVELQDARNFSLSGCHEVIVTGLAQTGSVEGFVNMPMIVRMVLGLEPRQWDARPLDEIHDFDHFQKRITSAMDHVTEKVHQASILRDERAAGMTTGTLMTSLVTGDFIDRALGYTQGGARYNFCNWDIIGIANLADSLNAKLDPRLLEDEEGIARVAALIRGHFDSGGQQLQFNFYTREMLMDAKLHPEKHSDLMVRVTGYSAPFVSLWEDLQDEVIARTDHMI